MNPSDRRLADLFVVDAYSCDYHTLFAELRPLEVRINLFSTGERALRATGACSSTLWVVNFRLPDMSGIGFLTLVRRRFRRSSVFLVGDVYSVTDEVAARSAGATAYVCKPPSVAWLEGYLPRCRSPTMREPTSMSSSQAAIRPP